MAVAGRVTTWPLLAMAMVRLGSGAVQYFERDGETVLVPDGAGFASAGAIGRRVAHRLKRLISATVTRLLTQAEAVS
jgi:hypothetical protein